VLEKILKTTRVKNKEKKSLWYNLLNINAMYSAIL
jgi:hypothetical protein